MIVFVLHKVYEQYWKRGNNNLAYNVCIKFNLILNLNSIKVIIIIIIVYTVFVDFSSSSPAIDDV